MEHEGDYDTNCGWCTLSNPQRIGKETGRLGNKRTIEDDTDYSITKIGKYKTQQNSRCKLCGDKDETINHIINKCSKLAQKEY